MGRSKAKGFKDSVNLKEAVVVRVLSDVAEDGSLRGSTGSGRANCNSTARLECDVDEPVEAVGASGCLEEAGDHAAVDLHGSQLGRVEELQEDVVSTHIGQHLSGVTRVGCYIRVEEGVLGQEDREGGARAHLRYNPCLGEEIVKTGVRWVLR